jgi:hypothetical protein
MDGLDLLEPLTTRSPLSGVVIFRPLAFLASSMLTVSLLTVGALASVPTISAATIAATTTCGNSVDNTPGLGAICETTVENTITSTGGSAHVTVRECHGAAGDPEASCSTVTKNLTEPVTVMTQCNAAESGAGGTLRCSVQVTNTFVEDPSPIAVTVNQCVGSGDGQTVGCDPFPATTTGAVITQCNGSANGGTLVGLTCEATGTTSPAFAVEINQCNGSANGGGSLVICSANVDNVFEAVTPSSAPSAAPSSRPSATPRATATPVRPRLTPPPTDRGDVLDSGIAASNPLLLVGLLVLLGSVAGSVAVIRRHRLG